jgi:hypothetical protein
MDFDKKQVLDAILKNKMYSDEFEHNLEDSRTTFACKKYEIESELYNIIIEFEEEAYWNDVDEYVSQNVKVVWLSVIDFDGREWEHLFDYDEIEFSVDY